MGNVNFQRSVLEHSNNSQKMDLEWASVWKANCKEFQRKIKRFRRSVVLEHSNNSQEMDLECASVSRGQCKEFQGKI